MAEGSSIARLTREIALERSIRALKECYPDEWEDMLTAILAAKAGEVEKAKESISEAEWEFAQLSREHFDLDHLVDGGHPHRSRPGAGGADEAGSALAAGDDREAGGDPHVARSRARDFLRSEPVAAEPGRESRPVSGRFAYSG